ncbi:unnamed protein product [Rotaria sp. Silwood1]|nr:unnamed protein product [Rotaria sp. Silwood1]CAF3685219.1 unnamed protein product [Rotaria sp. Silwood1]
MNSVLQSLLFTSSLTNYFLLNENTEDSTMKNISVSKEIVASEYLNLLYLLYCGEYNIVTPGPFKQGTYLSTTTCQVCSYASHNYEPFICLTLPIPSTNQCTLEDCFKHFNQDEYLINDSRWFCPRCQRLCNGRKRLEIYKLPKILIIQLKR